MANFCKGIGLPTGFPIAVPCKHPKTLKKDVETAQVLFPHIMFSRLATNSSFDKLFPLDCWESFWAQAEKTDDDRLINHPLKKRKSWKKCCLPLFVHGGGVEFQSRDTSWFTAGGHPWARRIHCAVTCTLLASPRAAPWMIPGSLCGSGYHGALQPCKTDTTPPMTPKGRH